jgi:hypothetical protein
VIDVGAYDVGAYDERGAMPLVDADDDDRDETPAAPRLALGRNNNANNNSDNNGVRAIMLPFLNVNATTLCW